MDEEIEYQFDAIAEEYKAFQADTEQSRYELEVIWPAIYGLLPEAPAHIMDYGCGGGAYARKLLAEGYDVLAVDNVPAMIAELSDIEDYAKVWSYRDTPMNDTFDVIIANFVVQFVVDLPAFARSMHDHLEYGGKLIISVPHPNRSAQRIEGSENGVYEEQIGDSELTVEMIHRELSEYKKVFAAAGLQLIDAYEPIDPSDATAPAKRLDLLFERYGLAQTASKFESLIAETKDELRAGKVSKTHTSAGDLLNDLKR